jgi:Flp pilus assembly pilin Flp
MDDDGRRGRDERGQASVEHAAVVALVLVVLTAAAGVAGGMDGAGIVNAVHSGVRRALCVAGGDDCAAFHVQEPCAVAREEDVRSQGLSFGIWRIGVDRSVAVERRSDGSVVVTAYDDVEGGVGTSAGLRFGIGRSSGGDGDGGVSATIGAEGRLRGGWGRSWELRSPAEARELVRRLAAKDPVRAPDVDRVRLGAGISGSGELHGPGVDVTGSVLQGLRGEGTRDRRTGRTTVSLAVSRAAAGDLAGPLGLRLGGDVELEPSATLVTDRDLRPRELRLVGTLVTRDGARRRDVQVRVDLTRAEVGQGVAGILRGLASADAGRARSAAVALGRWAADEGWVDQREYGAASTTEGLDVELALGAGLGIRDQDTHRTERLLSARTRPPGGLWEDRTDCVGGA